MRAENKSQGYVNILCLNMSAGNKTIDLLPYVARVDLYESILASGVIAEIVVTDATTMFSSFNNEEICLSFTTYEESPPVHYKLKIISTRNASSPPNEKGVVYNLTCVTPEVYTSMNIKNLPLVRNKDILSEEAVQMMLNVLKTEKELFAEKTSGLYSVSSANQTPFQFIDSIRRDAISEKHKASAFVFFENKFGYHFKSLEQLVEDGKKNIGDKMYIYHNLANIDVTGSNWRTIIGAKQLQVGNDLVAGLIGGNKNTSTEFDYVRGEFTRHDDDVSTAFETVSMNDDSVFIDTKRQEENQDDGNQSVILYDFTAEKHELAEKYNKLPYYISKFLTVIQHITVYGDSTVTIGDLIKVRFPERSGLTLGNDNPMVEYDKHLSGNYMICKCRHVLILEAGSHKYYQAFEIVKDGLGGEMPKARV